MIGKKRKLTLLLVDDNKLLTDSMAYTLPWESVGIGTVHKAYSGPEAIDVLEKSKVDVLITDIRMPGITGLELIEQARVIHPALQCILLTGFAQFEYAKRAIELKAINYLVKPIKDQDILKAVEESTIQLSRNAIEEKKILQLNLPRIRSELLLDLLSEEGVPLRTLEEKLTMYDLPFAIGGLCRLILIDPDSSLERYSSGDRSLFEYSIMNIAEETLSPLYTIWFAKNKRRLLVMLIRPRGEEELQADTRRAAVDQLQKNVSHYLNSNLSIYLSPKVKFPNEVTQAYWNGQAKLQLRAGDPTRSFVLEEGGEAEIQKPGTLRTLHQSPSFMQLVETKNWEGLRNKMQALFAELEASGAHWRPHITEVHMHLLSSFISMAHGEGRVLEEIIGPFASDPSQPIRSLERLRNWVTAILDLLTQELGLEWQDDVHAHIVSQVQQFVRKNLDKDIALNTIAEHVYLNPAYLSKLYKDKTAMRLSDFILQTRMEQAMLLLKNPALKIYEIAEMIGYQSAQHFIREFKRFHGAPPKKYRTMMK